MRARMHGWLSWVKRRRFNEMVFSPPTQGKSNALTAKDAKEPGVVRLSFAYFRALGGSNFQIASVPLCDERASCVLAVGRQYYVP